MKGILPTLQSEHEEATRIEQVAKKQKEYKLVGSQRKVSGHTLFEFNKSTKEIKPADVKRECIMDFKTGKPVYRTKTDMHENCFYIQALNVKNAIKKLKKLGSKI
jgi:hypothetical protein